MNRGNLAEDPRAGLSSSSRYSRDGGERNSLLYVDSSSQRKERRAAERRAGKQAGAIKGNHNSRKSGSVGRGLADSHMNRLEVGSDGRLFHVKESPVSSTSAKKTPSETEVRTAESSTDIQTNTMRPAISESVDQTEADTSRRAKPDRSYLNQENPLLKKTRTSRRLKSGRQTAEEKKTAGQQNVSAEQQSATAQASAAQQPVKTSQSTVEQSAKEAQSLSVQQPATEVQSSATQKSAAKAQPSELQQPAKSKESSAKQRPAIAAQPSEAQEDASSQRKPSLLYRFRVPLIVSAITAVSVGYGYTAWHYTDRFYPGTEFFGIPAAEQSVYDVKAAVKAKVDSYSLQLEARNPEADASAAAESAFSGDNIIHAEDVAMVYRDNGEIDQVMKRQKSWAWPVMMLAQLFGHKDSVLETSFDESLVPDVVSSLACMQKENMIQPEDAKIVLTDDGAKVQPEVYGTTLDRERTEEAVRKALIDGSTSIDLDELDLYENPKITGSDLSLTTDAMAMNKVLGAKVLLRFGDRTEVINSEVISSFLGKERNTYYLNEEKVRDYVTSLADKYDTCQREREFTTSIGTKVTLEEGIGDYGWLLDQEATYEELLEAIRSQKKTTLEPVYTQEAYCRAADDIGDTYVEISLTNQKMWFYKNGELVVETPVVTGNPYAGHETPSGGVWSVKDRARNQTLSGQGYASPVDYWMPFNGGVGIHDLQSRAWFGGSIYLGSGSHGCVNTPLAAVKLIYDQMEIGVPVIVYKDESEEAQALITGPSDVQSLNAQIEETFGTVEDDGIGSIVAWSKTKAGQAQTAQVLAQAQALAAGTPVS